MCSEEEFSEEEEDEEEKAEDARAVRELVKEGSEDALSSVEEESEESEEEGRRKRVCVCLCLLNECNGYIETIRWYLFLKGRTMTTIRITSPS